MLQVSVNTRVSEIEKPDDQLLVNGNPVNINIRQQANGLIDILYNNKCYNAMVEKIDRANKEVTLNINGQYYTVSVREQMDILLNRMGMNMQATHKTAPVKAPMPGMILKIFVEQGQQVSKGDSLIILEAMKMENVLKASANSIVKAIKISERTAVEKGTVLIEME